MTVIAQVEKLLYKDRVCMDTLPTAVAAAQVLVTAKKDDVVVAADEFQHTAGLRMETGVMKLFLEFKLHHIGNADGAGDRFAIEHIKWKETGVKQATGVDEHIVI